MPNSAKLKLTKGDKVEIWIDCEYHEVTIRDISSSHLTGEDRSGRLVTIEKA